MLPDPNTDFIHSRDGRTTYQCQQAIRTRLDGTTYTVTRYVKVPKDVAPKNPPHIV